MMIWLNFNNPNLLRLEKFSSSPTKQFSLLSYRLKLATRLSSASHALVIASINVVSSFFALFLQGYHVYSILFRVKTSV